MARKKIGDILTDYVQKESWPGASNLDNYLSVGFFKIVTNVVTSGFPSEVYGSYRDGTVLAVNRCGTAVHQRLFVCRPTNMIFYRSIYGGNSFEGVAWKKVTLTSVT